MFQDVEGRWFSFSIEPTTLVILEKKNLAAHLQDLEAVEKPVTVQSLLMDFEDCGEAGLLASV